MNREGWRISKHDQLRELCVLAAAGDVPPMESERLRIHLNECAPCRQLFEELRDLHAVEFANLPCSAVAADSQRESRLKDSILRAARGESLRLADAEPSVMEHRSAPIRFTGPIRPNRRLLVGISIGALAASLVFAFSPKRVVNPPLPSRIMEVAAVPVAPAPQSQVANEQSHEEQLLRAKVAALEGERASLEHRLEHSESENQKLQSDQTEKQKEVADLSTDLQRVRAEEASASQKLEQLNADRANQQVAIAAQNREIVSLNERLEAIAASQDRNLDVVSAERQLRELVGARNFHLQDVYDTDSDGKTKKAFGRVFYAEGQTLLFYAYDLSDRHSDNGKYAYYVWGNKDGNLEAVRNLGALNRDDDAQKRWKLKVSDAKVLADIDRVFVTVEAVGKLGPRPRGKQILHAYLGSPPNHP